MDPYIGEIRLFTGNFAPKGWALCDGSTMYVQQNPILFSVIGNRYGGDGRTTYALPNLQGTVPVGQGAGPGLTPRSVGETFGNATETLTIDQIPNHSHVPQASSVFNAGKNDPANNIWGAEPANPPILPKPYASNPDVDMNVEALSATGGGQPHNNMQPYLTLSFIIALEGIYPQKP